MKHFFSMITMIIGLYGKIFTSLGRNFEFLAFKLPDLQEGLTKIEGVETHLSNAGNHFLAGALELKRAIKKVESAVKSEEVTPEVRKLQETLLVIKSLFEGMGEAIDFKDLDASLKQAGIGMWKSAINTHDGQELLASFPVVEIDSSFLYRLGNLDYHDLKIIIESLEKKGWTNIYELEVSIFNPTGAQLITLKETYIQKLQALQQEETEAQRIHKEFMNSLVNR